MIDNSLSKPWPVSPMMGDACWWVLRTKTRQEKVVASNLSSMKILFFFPTIRAERYIGNRKHKIEVPLFPSYLFLHGDRDATFRIDRTKRVAGILSVDDQEQLHRQLGGLHKALQVDARFDPYPYLVHGTWAEVKSGPYKGVQGKVDRESHPTKLILQVDLLRSGLSLELNGAILEVL